MQNRGYATQNFNYKGRAHPMLAELVGFTLTRTLHDKVVPGVLSGAFASIRVKDCFVLVAVSRP
jgi:hypothetical protein